MYGTIARLKIKSGSEEKFKQFEEEQRSTKAPGIVFQHVYRSDSDPDEYFLAVGFESKAAYVANAKSPEQKERYQQYRALLAADPEWHDGEIVSSRSS
jgi:heme-degrading monooxygenase HmoA